ncbi:PAN-3 domain-containing protein [Caenorhabditis elegans]|uniref:PAN-3 domain-containing protein n=1 Tax=Caenorhabditis elegans TaxID=6239 RepID=A0A5S9MNF3_CAEEL|nr:PAN-3 domain-containing protein [Caenorhabditis elegans]CAA0059164.1 PAN-3 domain-containing protein [Caenorhabditis elegans]
MTSLLSFLLFIELWKLTTSETYMVAVKGSPVPSTSYGTSQVGIADWRDCAQKCLESSTCILAYSSTEVCVLYAVGDVIQVKNDQEGYANDKEEKVAFKVQSSADSCTYMASGLLDGIVTPYNKEHIDSYEIKTTPEFYTIAYTYDSNMDKCGNWFEPKPQCSVCTSTMFSSFLKQEPTGTVAEQIEFVSWSMCLFECSSRPDCFMAAVDLGSNKCKVYNYGGVDQFEYSDAPTTFAGGLKYTPASYTCSSNFSSLSDGRYVHTLTSTPYSSYQYNGTAVTWIPRQSCKDADAHLYTGLPGCFKFIRMPWPIKHPQSYSTAICVAFGADGLMPIPGAGGYDVFYAIKPLQRTVDVGYVRDNTTL